MPPGLPGGIIKPINLTKLSAFLKMNGFDRLYAKPAKKEYVEIDFFTTPPGKMVNCLIRFFASLRYAQNDNYLLRHHG